MKSEKFSYQKYSETKKVGLIVLILRTIICPEFWSLTFSWWRLLSYRNQSIDFFRKSVDWFLYDNGLRHESFNRHLESNDLLFVNIRCIIKLTTLSCRYVFIYTTEVLQVNDDVIRSAVKPAETLNKNTNILGLKSNLWETL